jgi:AcrR family transcriptional regulator
LHDGLMPQAPTAGTSFDVDDGPAGRILRSARDMLATVHYSGLTMDALAHELGMSKKTLYAHFASKDAIVAAIIEATGRTIRRESDAILNDPSLSFTQRLRGVLSVVGAQLGVVTPTFLRDIQRFAPDLHRRIDELRAHNIPIVFGRILQLGVAEGMLRPDLDVTFAVEFWLQAMNGLLQTQALARTDLTPRATFERAVDIFFLGLLSAEGRRDYRRHHQSPPPRTQPG